MKPPSIDLCDIEGCSRSSIDSIIYAVHKEKDPYLFEKWTSVIPCGKTKQKVQACQRHFPAGAPTKNHPAPEQNLFNPLMQQAYHEDDIIEEEVEMDINDFTPVRKKRRKSQEIDESEVSFVEFTQDTAVINLEGSDERQSSHSGMKKKNAKKVAEPKNKKQSRETFEDSLQRFNTDSNDTERACHKHSEFKRSSVGSSLNQMRLLKIDCNMTIIDHARENSMQVHRAVLIAKSPFLYEELYIRYPKKCYWTTPDTLSFEAVEAVVTMMYTDSLADVMDKPPAEIKKVLLAFYMKTEQEEFEASLKAIEPESLEEPEAEPVLSEDEKEPNDPAPKKKIVRKIKLCVEKIIEKSLNPFLEEINELLNPSSNTLETAKSADQVITLWQSDILLSRLFDQTALTKYFSDVMSEVFKKGVIENPNVGPEDTDAYSVEALCPRTLNREIDEAYNDVNTTAWQPSEGCDTSEDSSIIPYYVHLVAAYRFRVCVNKIRNSRKSHQRGDTRDYLELVNEEVKNKIIMSLNSNNFSYQEELIIHVIVGRIDEEGYISITLAFFLSKGCWFCLKSKCSRKDLTEPITPVKPVCPDRQCIKQNLLCEVCGKQMSSSSSVQSHKHQMHGIETGDCSTKYTCRHCGEEFFKKFLRDNHERKKHLEVKMNIPCPHCQKIMKGPTILRAHIRSVHEYKDRFKCDICGRGYKSSAMLRTHKRTHTGEKPFQCMYCDYASVSNGNLKLHIGRKHKDEDYQESDSDDLQLPTTYITHPQSDDTYIIP